MVVLPIVTRMPAGMHASTPAAGTPALQVDGVAQSPSWTAVVVQVGAAPAWATPSAPAPAASEDDRDPPHAHHSIWAICLAAPRLIVPKSRWSRACSMPLSSVSLGGLGAA